VDSGRKRLFGSFKREYSSFFKKLFIFVMTGGSKDESPEFSLSSLEVSTSTNLVFNFQFNYIYLHEQKLYRESLDKVTLIS